VKRLTRAVLTAAAHAAAAAGGGRYDEPIDYYPTDLVPVPCPARTHVPLRRRCRSAMPYVARDTW
jgi:hypothetical protein